MSERTVCPWCKKPVPLEGSPYKASDYESCPHCGGSFSFGKPIVERPMSSEKVAGVPEDVRAAATEAMGLMDQPLMAGRQPTRSMELAMILARHILTPRQWPLVTEEGGNLPVALRNTEITERDVETLLQAARDMIQPRPQDQPLPPVTEEQVEVLARNLYGPPMTDAAWRCVEGTAHWIVCMNHARIALEFCRSFGE